MRNNIFQIKDILKKNMIRFFIYISIVFIVICIINNRIFNIPIVLITYIKEIGFPASYITIFIVSILYLLFVLITSSITVIQEQNYFKTSLVLRIFLFIMNVLPIVFFSKILFFNYGFRVIYFFIVYVIIKLLIDYLSKNLLNIRNVKISIIKKYIIETIIICISVYIVNIIIPQKYIVFGKEQFNPKTIFELLTYFLFIIMFNSISFFTNEYCISTFRKEYKKNYSKYYFIYNYSIINRIIYVLKKTLPQVLIKIKNNITWLIMFIITVEIIFENNGNRFSIGSNINNFYNNKGISTEGLIVTIFYIIFILFIINTVIDIIIYLHKHKEKHEIYQNNNNDNPILPVQSKNKLVIILTFAIAIFLILFIFTKKEYAFAGYYNFSEKDIEKGNLYTLLSDYENSNIGIENNMEYYELIDGVLKPKSEYNIPFFIKKNNYYSLIKITKKDYNGECRKLIPFYDKINTPQYSFIENAIYTKGLLNSGISKLDKIVNIEYIDKYKNVAFTDIMTGFRLSTFSNKTEFYDKPLYLILPFYFLFYILLLLITITYTYFVYYLITKYIFIIQNKERYYNLKKYLNEVFMFLSALTLLVVLLIINLIIQRLSATSSWENKSLTNVIISYSLIQIIINFMFTAAYKDDILNNINNIIDSNEFKYYNTIGINSKNILYIYNKKYGSTFILKQIFQNIIFLFNINWFICYVFNYLRDFNDSIGITYTISIENIFTKVMLFNFAEFNINLKENIFTLLNSSAFYNYIILFGINMILFIGYNYYQKKLSLGDK
jgi:hypothetical protein